MKCLCLLLPVVLACGGTHAPSSDRATAAEPIAAQHPHDVVAAAGTRSDPYYWLRDDTRTNPEVLDHLRAENAYHDAAMATTTKLQDALYGEIVARIQEDDTTVPFLDGGYWYYTRFETGKERAIIARRKGTMTASEEIVVDANARAVGHAYFRLGTWAVSRDGARVAWTEDTVGRNQFALRVAELATGEVLDDAVLGISDELAWANDGKTLFYVGKDPTTLRESKVYRHVLGDTAPDVLVHDETDGAYYTSVATTKSHRYVQIVLSSTLASEVRLIDADAPTATPRVFLRARAGPRVRPRSPRRPVRDPHQLAGEELPPDVGHRRQGARPHLLARHRRGERRRLRQDLRAVPQLPRGRRPPWRPVGIQIIPSKGATSQVAVDEPTYSMSLVDVPDVDATGVRYTYQSLTTPPTVYEQDLATGARSLLKRDAVLGSFDPADYVAEYLHATARDGTQVPISVVRHKDTAVDGTAPVLIYGYGAYGVIRDATFDAARLSLLDRGWVFAIAHVRGGQELGRAWYEDGKLLRKRNTFTDFIDCSEHLVAQRYAARAQVHAVGGSAGGLLMGAIVNLRPDLYRGVIAKVPFVDVVTTMLDETIPLTTNEFDEWGNPTDPTYYDYMMSYSPYDNVRAQAYPSLLVTTSLWDSQVQYYEPAKWVARLRATRTDESLLLFHVDMEAGHSGKSGRFEALRETAHDYAFLLTIRDRPDRRLDKRP